MLSVPAPFPHPGSPAFIKGSGQEVRIIQFRADGTLTVAVAEQYKSASSTRTLSRAELCETRALALAPAPRRRRPGLRAGAAA